MTMLGVPRERRPKPTSKPPIPPAELARHLVQDHGLPAALVGNPPSGWGRWALEMQHAADHSQRLVGHQHD